jgi:protease-4
MRPISSLPLPGRDRRLLLELDLTRPLLESVPSSPVAALRARHALTVRAVVDALRKAARDPQVVGLVAHVGHRHPSLAQSGEVRAAVRELAAAGKPTVCWSESYGETGPGNIPYHLASAFDEVWVQPSGDVGLVGVTAEAVFFKETLDKLGVQAQIGQRREYKTAANAFLQSEMTEAHREMLDRIVVSATETLVRDVAETRGLDEQAVRDAVDEAPLSAEEARARGLVDRIGYRDEVMADLRRRLGDADLRYVERYAKLVAARGAAQQVARGATTSGRHRPQVAVIPAAGGIHLGRSTSSPGGAPSVGSDSLGAALRAAASDDDVHAVVLRVDSPGGSYVASDAIRREVHQLRSTGKPVVASMAGVAASGGYYIAMGADEIVALPGTLTGSIGVVAGKQVTRDALGKIGVTTDSVSAGRYADMFSSQRPFTDDEWQRLESWLDRVYDDFTRKAAQDRGMEHADLEQLARGRVWTGADARARGLVDGLGGLTDAVDAACRRAGLDRDRVHVRTARPSLVERLRPAENSDHPAAAGLGLGPGEGGVLLDLLLAGAGLPVRGALTMPFGIRLR